MDAEERAQQQQQQQQPLPDVQKLWEKAQIEVALEGSNGCKLERLWHLLGLTPNVGGGDGSTESASSHAGGGATSTSTTATAPAVGGDGGGDGDDPKIFLRGWLWRRVAYTADGCSIIRTKSMVRLELSLIFMSLDARYGTVTDTGRYSAGARPAVRQQIPSV